MSLTRNNKASRGEALFLKCEKTLNTFTKEVPDSKIWKILHLLSVSREQGSISYFSYFPEIVFKEIGTAK